MEKMRQRLLKLKNSRQPEPTTENLQQQLEEVKISHDLQILTNAVQVPVNNIFEYIISFKPSIITKLQLTFLKRFFTKMKQVFTYHEYSAFTIEKIDEGHLEWTLFSKKLQTNVTMELVPVEVHIRNVELFQRIVDTECESAPLLLELRPSKFVYSLHHNVDNNLLLFVDCENYAIEEQNVKEMSECYQKLYGKSRYQDVLDFFLNKSLIHHTRDNVIYKFKKIDVPNNTLDLESKDQIISASLDECHIAKHIFDVNECRNTLRQRLEKFFNRLKIDSVFLTVSAYMLSSETIIFGDSVSCKKSNWTKDLRNNEVFTSVQLWCWVIMYQSCDEDIAKKYGANVQNLQDNVGISIGRPLYFLITGDSKNDYVHALKSIASKDLQLVVVILSESQNKPEALIKHINCINNPVPTRLLNSVNIKHKEYVHDSVLEMNAVLGGSLWYVALPEKIMVCAIDTYIGFDQKFPPVCSSVTNLACDGIQWYSTINYLDKNSINDRINDATHKFFDINGQFPEQVVVYHTCTDSLLAKTIKCYNDLSISLKITVVLVSNDVKLCCFNENVAVGTVIRDKIAESNDFFLFSSAGGGVPRPTHYTVIKDTAGISPNVLEELTFKMCHLYYKRANVVRMPAPCIYARKQSKLVTETIYDIPSQVLNDYLYYL